MNITQNPMTDAHRDALELLRATCDSAYVEQAEQIVTAGLAAWVFDPEHYGVIGLVITDSDRAVAVAYVLDEDVEFGDEFFTITEGK